MAVCSARQRRRGGNTLLELVGATTILTIALVPALKMMRDGMRVGRETEMANLMATLAASKLEEHLMRTAAAWNPGTVSGDFAATGYNNLKFAVVMSDDAADGGATDVLMAITSTVWDDRNDDDVWDAGEPRVFYASKQARNVAYQQEANGN